MPNRVEHFAARFAAGNEEVISTVLACTDEQWRQPCAKAGWSVGVVAHPIATI